MGNLGAWLVSLAGPIVRRVLIALGVGVVSYSGLSLLVSAVKDRVLENLGGLSGSAYQVVAMSGAFEAVGILLGALSARAALMAVDRIGKMTAPAP